MSASKPPQPLLNSSIFTLRGSLLTLAILTLTSFTFLSLKSLRSPPQQSPQSIRDLNHGDGGGGGGEGELSEVYHSAEVFRSNCKEMERRFKVYVYEEGDPETFYQTPRKLTGKYASEGYFFSECEGKSVQDEGSGKGGFVLYSDLVS